MAHPSSKQTDGSEGRSWRRAASNGLWVILLLIVVGLLVLGWRTMAQGQLEEAAADAGPVVARPVADPIPTMPVGEESSAEASQLGDQANAAPVDDNSPAETVSITTTGEMTETVPAVLVPINPLHRTTNILLLGSDRRPADVNWRTDVVMILALDLDHHAAGVISIPRDLYVDEIENHLPNKINVVDYLGEQDDPGGGGPALLAEILAERMDVPIDHYLRFEFEGFKEVIDALGGVEIQIDCPIYDFLDEEDIAINLQPGTHRLTGSQALSYVRTRRQGGDLERARHQQRMALAIRDQMLSENLLPRVPALYVALQGAVATDIGLVDAIRFVRFALQLTEEEVHGMILTPPDTMISGWRRGMFVFLPDWPVISETIQSLFDRPPLIDTNTVGPAGDVQTCR